MPSDDTTYKKLSQKDRQRILNDINAVFSKQSRWKYNSKNPNSRLVEMLEDTLKVITKVAEIRAESIAEEYGPVLKGYIEEMEKRKRDGRLKK